MSSFFIDRAPRPETASGSGSVEWRPWDLYSFRSAFPQPLISDVPIYKLLGIKECVKSASVYFGDGEFALPPLRGSAVAFRDMVNPKEKLTDSQIFEIQAGHNEALNHFYTRLEEWESMTSLSCRDPEAAKCLRDGFSTLRDVYCRQLDEWMTWGPSISPVDDQETKSALKAVNSSLTKMKVSGEAPRDWGGHWSNPWAGLPSDAANHMVLERGYLNTDPEIIEELRSELWPDGTHSCQGNEWRMDSDDQVSDEDSQPIDDQSGDAASLVNSTLLD